MPAHRLTAEEFADLPDDGALMELIDGVPRPLPFPFLRHGEICARVGTLLLNFLHGRRLGRATGNVGVVTRRSPDTVREADVAFYSFARYPADVRFPSRGYGSVSPDVVFEVRSSTDRWTDTHVKIADFLNAGVATVVVVDDQARRVWMFHAHAAPDTFAHDQKLTPPPLDGWRVNVRQFFE